MKINSTLEKKLLKYSALTAGAVAITVNADAQIIYYDESPDVVLTGNGSMHNIDFDGDSTPDISVGTVIGNFSGATSSGATYVVNYNAGVAITAPGNMIIGSIGSSSSANAAALASGVNVGSTGAFVAADSGGMMAFFATFTFPAYSYGGSFSGGAWSGVTDMYLGVRFVSGASTTHYGWVRMDLTADGTTLTVKDWAYNGTANGSILTGQSVGLNSISEDLALIRFFNNRLDLKVVNGTSGNVTVVNMEGKVVYNEAINESYSSIDLSNLSAGLYVVNAEFAEGSVQHKIVIR